MELVLALYLVHPRLWRSERQANILTRKENSMTNSFRLRAVLLLGGALALLPVACSSNGSSNSSSGNSGMNMAGAWTVTAESTEGKGGETGDIHDK
jgi:hypothetical protein